MKKNIFYLLMLLSLFMGLRAHAQGLSLSTTYQTPEVASLGRMALIPANPFNGQAAASIPLYEVKYKELSIPISLNYNTGGNRVDDHPGWVGLGWTLKSGGVIFRKVNGLYDEHPKETPTGTYSNEIGYYYNCGKVQDNFNNVNAIKKYAFDGVTNAEKTANAYDAYPDEFIFDFNGYSGRFFITRPYDNGPLEIKVQPFGPYKLKAEIMAMKDSIVFDDFLHTRRNSFETRFTNRNIYKIKITDENGVQYIFGGNSNSIDFSNSGDLSRDFYTIASAWHLTEVISQFGYKINLNYARKGRTFVQQKQRNALFYDASYNFSTNLLFLFRGETGNIRYSGSKESTWIIIQNPVYLKSIVTPEQTINFSTSKSDELDYVFDNQRLEGMMDPDQYKGGGAKSSWQKLDEIDIVGYRKIRFDYRSEANSRLRLNRINLLKTTGESNQEYSFKYNNLQLPAYNSKMADHWGYYNGRSYAYSDNYQINREPVEQYLQAEILNLIIYPTGGSMRLEYEPHYYKRVANQFPFIVNDEANVKMAGGLRVRKLTTIDPNGIPMVKEYFYVKDYVDGGTVSSGVLSGLPQYANAGTRRSSFKTGNFWAGSWGSFNINFGKVIDNNFLTLSTTNGNFVTYTEVTEKSNDGFITYKYSNHDNGYHDKEPYIIHSNFDSKWHEEGFNSLESFRGLLLEQKIYSSNKSPLKRVSYEYAIDTASSHYKVPYFYRIYDESLAGIPLSRVSSCAFYLKPALIKKVVETNYFAGLEPITQERTNRFYPEVIPGISPVNDNFKEKEIIQKNSKNEQVRTLLKYPFDLVNEGLDYGGVYSGMLSKNMNSQVIERSDYSSGNMQIGLNRTNFFSPFNGVYVPKSIESQGKSTDPLEAISRYHVYDSQGNPLSVSQEGGPKTNYLWSYKKTYPVIEVKNADYTAIENVLGSPAIEALSNSIPDKTAVDAVVSTLRTNLPNAQVTSYTYKPLVGLASQTDAKGLTTYYRYDSFNRLEYILDQDENIVKRFSYNYAPIYYYNESLSQNFIKACSVGTGTSIAYMVVAGKYNSIISQAHADAQAQAEIDANGQNYANANGVCAIPFSINTSSYDSYFPEYNSEERNVTIYVTLSAPLSQKLTITGSVEQSVSPGGTNTQSFTITIPAGATNGIAYTGFVRDTSFEQWSGGEVISNVTFTYTGSESVVLQ